MGNRSALWADLKQHRLAISDINLAIEAGYPDTLMHKLYERRAKCHLGLRRDRERRKWRAGFAVSGKNSGS